MHRKLAILAVVHLTFELDVEKQFARTGFPDNFVEVPFILWQLIVEMPEGVIINSNEFAPFIFDDKRSESYSTVESGVVNGVKGVLLSGETCVP